MEDELPKITFRRNRSRDHQRLRNLQQQKQTRDEESRVPPLPSITNLYSKEWDDLPELGGQESRASHYGDSLPDLYIPREDAVESLLDTDDQSNNENSLLAAKRNLVRSKSMVEYSGKHLERDRMKFKRKKKKRMSVDMMRSKSNAILGELFAVNQSSDSDCICVVHETPVKLLKGSEADSCDSDVPVRRCIRKPKCIIISEDSELSDTYLDNVSHNLSRGESQLKNYSQNKKVLKDGKEKSSYSIKKTILTESEEVPKLQNKVKVNIKTLQEQTDSLQDTAAGGDKEFSRQRPPSGKEINSCNSGSLNSRTGGVFDFLNSLKSPEIDRNAKKKLNSECCVLLRDCTLVQGNDTNSDRDRHFMDILSSEIKELSDEDSPYSADKSLNYSLKSSEYSDISDTDDDRGEEVPSHLVPNKDLLKHQRLSSAYSDISEESGTETNDKELDPSTGSSQIMNSSQSTTFMAIQTVELKHPVFLRHDRTCNENSDISDLEDNKSNNDLTEKEAQFASESNCDTNKTLHDLFINGFQKQTENTGYDVIAQEKAVSNCQTEEDSIGKFLENKAENFPKYKYFDQDNHHLVHTDENDKETAENILMEEISDNESSCTRYYSNESSKAEIEKFLDDVCSIISTPDSSDYSDNDEDDEISWDRGDNRNNRHPSNFTGTDYNLKSDISEIYHERDTSEEEETLLYSNGVPVTQQGLSFRGKIIGSDTGWKLTSENRINDEGGKSEVNEVSYIRDLNKFDTELPDLNLTQTYVCNSEDYGAESMHMSNDMLDCSQNTSMPYLSAVSPLTFDSSSYSAEESRSTHVNTHSSVNHSSPVMPVLSPVRLNCETAEQLSSSVRRYPRKRTVRCIKTKDSVKQSLSIKRKRYVSKGKTDPEKLSQLGNSGMIMNQLCHYVKNYCCVSGYQSPKVLLPSTQMNILDECRVDGCHNFSHFFYFLSHYCSNYIIPSEVYSFICKNILFENGASQSVIRCAQDFLSKVTSDCRSTFELTWKEVETCIQGMMNSDLSVKTPEEVLQNEVFLELVISILKTDLYNRNLSNQREIHGSKVYRLLSTDVSSTNLKKVICFIQQLSHTMANNSTMDGFSPHLIKLLNILQEFLTFSIEVSSSCMDCAKSMALDLRNIYTYLPNISTRYLLLQSMSSELLLFYLCELILESRFDNTSPLCDISLGSVISSFFKALPQIDVTTPPATPSDDMIVNSRELACRYLPEQVEELTMLLYLIVKSYLKVTTGKLNMAIRRRSLCSSEELGLEPADVQILENWSGYVNSLQKHLGRLSSCTTAQTNHFLMLLECLADSV